MAATPSCRVLAQLLMQCNVFEGANGEVALTAGGRLRQFPGFNENFKNAAMVELVAPTSKVGLAPACKDTCFGDLRIRLWDKRYDGSEGKVILDVTRNMAAVEVGGGPWCNTWKGKTYTPETIRRARELPVDVAWIFGLFPFLKATGL